MGSEILTTFGLSVSATAETLRDFDRRFPKLRIEIQEVFPEVHLQLRPRHSAGKIIEDAPEG
jgi:hypothetical protein